MKIHHTFTALIGCVFLLTAFLIHHIVLSKESEDQDLVLQSKTRLLQSLAENDEIRLSRTKKVIPVIDRYNPSMPLNLKFKIAREIANASLKYDNLDVHLLCALITHEAGYKWDPKSVSRKGAMGLMQIMPATAKTLAEFEGIEWTTPEKILFDPVINIRLGSKYLSHLIELYEMDGGLAAYNGGGSRAALWLAKNRADGILYKETRNYVPTVLSLYKEFREYN